VGAAETRSGSKPWLVEDGLWERIEPLLPVVERRFRFPLIQAVPPIRGIARRGTEHGSGLGVHRWVVEGVIAPLHWFRRLRSRREIRDDIHHAFATLGCAASAGAG
jgi:hypothetical protein